LFKTDLRRPDLMIKRGCCNTRLLKRSAFPTGIEQDVTWNACQWFRFFGNRFGWCSNNQAFKL